jgi:hypothetical protein
MRMIQAHGDVIHSGLSITTLFPDPREFHPPRMSNPDLARALLSTYYVWTGWCCISWLHKLGVQ